MFAFFKCTQDPVISHFGTAHCTIGIIKILRTVCSCVVGMGKCSFIIAQPPAQPSLPNSATFMLYLSAAFLILASVSWSHIDLWDINIGKPFSPNLATSLAVSTCLNIVFLICKSEMLLYLSCCYPMCMGYCCTSNTFIIQLLEIHNPQV